MMHNTELRYGSVAKFFHWLTFILVLTLLLLGFFWENTGTIKGTVINVHKLIGLFTLIIIVLRALWTLRNVKPRIPNATRTEKLLEHSAHGLLYLALLGMPCSGWLMSTAGGRPPHVFGYSLPMPAITANSAVAAVGWEIHYILAWTLIVLASVHIIAALKHHFFNKDIVLKRMLPGNWN